MHLSALRPFVGLLAFALIGSGSLDVWAQDAPSTAPARRLTPRLRPRPPAPAPAPSAQPPEPARRTPPSPEPEEGTSRRPAPARPTPVRPTPVRPTPVPHEGASLPPASPGPGAGAPAVLVPYKRLPPPDGYVQKSKFNGALLGGGGLVLGITYVAAIAFAGSQGYDNGLGAVVVPVLGPWLAIGQRDFTCSVNTTPTDVDMLEGSTADTQECVASQTKTAAFLVGLGVGQLVGASLLTVGLLDRRRSWVRADLAGLTVDFDVAPGPQGGSIWAHGTF